MAVLLNSPNDDTGEFEAWRKPLLKLDPTMDLRVWPDTGRLEDIEYTLCWLPKPGDLKRYPNLKVIFNLGAGVDRLMADRTLPADVPVCRLVDEGLTAGMTEYVVWQALYLHRSGPRLIEQQRKKLWKPFIYPVAKDRRIGMLGLGVLGGDAGEKLSYLGFDVAGWSRTPKHVEGVKSYHGPEQLGAFLARTEILVCLLPLTPDTTGIVDSKLLAQLPKGATLINPGRGAHVVDADLIAALDSGHIDHAVLDVFHTEPLATDHPFWSHPRVTLTPHVASMTQPETAAPVILENMRRHKAGKPLLNEVDRKRGY
ncbi:MAG: 2-hydroxyacid dehydrogenase [Dongiaceae bacterium]